MKIRGIVTLSDLNIFLKAPVGQEVEVEIDEIIKARDEKLQDVTFKAEARGECMRKIWYIVCAVVCLIIALMFVMPLWIIWIVKQLWGIDWSQKYWAVFSLIMVIGILFHSNRTSK